MDYTKYDFSEHLQTEDEYCTGGVYIVHCPESW